MIRRMIRPMRLTLRLIAALLMTGGAGTLHAQPVDVTTLAAPDAFSTPGRDTGLPATLWRGASAATARTVLPLLAAKPLTPAGQQLARRVLATGAPGPAGVGLDAALIAARASALSAVGDPKAAAVVLGRAPGLDRSPELARAAAESALLAGDDARACAVAEGLSSGRDDVYWLRLRAYCQALAGKTAQAQLTFELAQSQSRDAVYGRLMAAKLAGGGAPGAASLRNGLDFALSRNLGLDVVAAKPAPAVGAALAGGDPNPPAWDLSVLDPAIAGLAGAMTAAQPLPAGGVSALIAAAADADPKSRAKLQGAALLAAALATELAPEDRARLAGFSLAEGKAPAGRSLALDEAARRRLTGETALLALWTLSDAGAAGPSVADRARIVRALAEAGLPTEARALAVEGLLALK
jgi:hypothetical protein